MAFREGELLVTIEESCSSRETSHWENAKDMAEYAEGEQAENAILEGVRVTDKREDSNQGYLGFGQSKDAYLEWHPS